MRINFQQLLAYLQRFPDCSYCFSVAPHGSELAAKVV